MDFQGYDWWVVVPIALVVAFALRAFYRGVMRLLFGMVCLAAGAWVGHQVFLHGRVWLTGVFGAPPAANTVIALAWVTGGLAYAGLAVGARNLAIFFVGRGNPFGPARLTGAVLSLVPSAFFIWVVISGVRASGLLADLELTDWSIKAEDGAEMPEQGWVTRISGAIERSPLGDLVQKNDPVLSGAAAKLTKLLVLFKDEDAWSALRENPDVAAVLSHPAVKRLTRDKDVLALVAHGDFADLMVRREIREASGDPEIASGLAKIDSDVEVRRALFVEPDRVALSPSAVTGSISPPMPPVGAGAASPPRDGESAAEGSGGLVYPRARPVRARRYRRGPRRN